MRPQRSRYGGYLVVLAVVIGIGVIGTFVLGRTYAKLALQKEPFARLSYTPSFDPIEDVTLGLSADSTNTAVSKPTASIRGIEVFPTQIILLAGGKAVRSINEPDPPTLAALARDINNQAWISERGHTVTLKAAVIVENGSTMTVAAPTTTHLVMQVRPGVFLAAEAATLHLAHVDIRASDTKTPATFSLPQKVDGRPFLLAVSHSTMTVAHSTLSYLGRDWNSSYGLSWAKHSTGSVTDSVFNHDFIGVYTNDSKGLRVDHSQFYYNSLYGIDPHSGSKDLVIDNNISDYNGRHGIIFSNHVTGGVVRNNVTKGNGLNGIMMDEASTGNVIEHNTVLDNQSDGIVMASSGNNTIVNNTVENNRIGITARDSSDDLTVTGNVITNNKLAAQGVSMRGNELRDNGGEWSAARIAVIWLSALALLVILVGFTWVSNFRRLRRGRRRSRLVAGVGSA